MRRFLAVVGLVLVVAGFVMIPLSLFYNIHFLVPVGLILASFLLLTYIKKMPSDLDENGNGTEPASDAQAAPEIAEEGETRE